MARTILKVIIHLAVLAAAAVACQMRESTSCQSNIVSSTVVATFCGHRQGDNEILDLLILWRSKAGWFQRHYLGSDGVGGSRVFGAGTRGKVSENRTYGDVTIAFDADFDSNVVTVGQFTVKLSQINTVAVDNVDGDWQMSETRWTEPHLPLVGDWNVALVQRSRALLLDLRCDLPMPAPLASYPVQQVPVITVCEKLKKQ
jgi:hypothetical protein